MAQRATDDDDDELELTPDMELDEDDEPDDDESDEGGEEEDEDEAAPPSFDEEEPPADGDNSVIRTLRERTKQLARENQELRTRQPAEPQLQLPDKPTLADFDYDEDKHGEALDAWYETRNKIENAKAEQDRLNALAEREWGQDVQNYASRRDALNLPDFEEAAEAVKANLSIPQQAVIVKAAGDSAAFVYALGRSDARLAELAKIHDPIKLAAAIARMEGGIKVVKKRKAPAPDRPSSGAARMPGGVDKQLEKLETEAERTGDRTAVIAYRKKLKAREKK